MALNLDPKAQIALDTAKRAVPEGQELGIGVLLSALYHTGGFMDELPDLAEYLPRLQQHRRETPEKVELSAPLKPVMTDLFSRVQGPLSPRDWFRELLASEAGTAYLKETGVDDETLENALSLLQPATETVGGPPPPDGGWYDSQERRQALTALDSFGRMLTQGTPRDRVFVEQEDALRSLVRVLVGRKQRNALVIGPPGTGKSALVDELARRLIKKDSSIPARLLDCDIFELSPSFLRSGASMVGEYDRRVKELLEVLRAHPRILLFVDEVHSLLQSGMHERTPFSDANEAFKRALSDGEITVIGCTTTAEYRHHIAGDEALAQRFSLVNIAPPSRAATRGILEARLSSLQEFYELDIPSAVLDEVVALTEDYMPARAQPRKSIQLLDQACAFCVTDPSKAREVSSEHLWNALQETIGRTVVKQGDVTVESMFEGLRERIAGQDAVLSKLAESVVAGLGSLAAHRKGPRGVYLFAGPTGVGKTHSAVHLSRVLGGGREALIRVNCNMLHASATDSGPAQNILLGVPPGYLGYVRGKGGELSKIRDHPQSVVLFDEIEKASSTIGDLLLQIIDEGRCEDADGNLLDFRRSFIIFTTNVGTKQPTSKRIVPPGVAAEDTEREVDFGVVQSGLRALGFHDAFLGRMDAFFVFEPLNREAVLEILGKGLNRLRTSLEDVGYRLDVDPTVAEAMAVHWQADFGARHILALLDRIEREFAVAEAARELEGLRTIRLAPSHDGEPGTDLFLTRKRENEILTILLK